nr:MAG TPA: hypothetical protein [Caudoviricetes sp.]
MINIYFLVVLCSLSIPPYNFIFIYYNSKVIMSTLIIILFLYFIILYLLL